MDLAIACYTLALKFTPEHEKDLRATILSNRSLMHKNGGNAEEALKDALDCVDSKPEWSKVKLPFNSSFHKISRLKVQPSSRPMPAHGWDQARSPSPDSLLRLQLQFFKGIREDLKRNFMQLKKL